MGRDGGRDGKAGGLRADLQQFACFCASPQLTCVRTKLIAKGLFAKCSQQVDLRTRFEVSANCCRSALRPPAFPDFCGSAFLCLGSDMLEYWRKGGFCGGWGSSVWRILFCNCAWRDKSVLSCSFLKLRGSMLFLCTRFRGESVLLKRIVDYISEVVVSVAFWNGDILSVVYKVGDKTIYIYCNTIKNN